MPVVCASKTDEEKSSFLDSRLAVVIFLIHQTVRHHTPLADNEGRDGPGVHRGDEKRTTEVKMNSIVSGRTSPRISLAPDIRISTAGHHSQGVGSFTAVVVSPMVGLDENWRTHQIVSQAAGCDMIRVKSREGLIKI